MVGPFPNASLFPDIAGLISHIHSNGQKAGIYWKPGVDRQAVLSNSQILGTTYHMRDILAVPNSAGDAFAASDPIRSLSELQDRASPSQGGASSNVDSIVAMFASWGVDHIRLDGVAPGSATLSIDNRPDVTAWSKAIAQSHRPIWLTISWAIDQDDFNTWQQYTNARRISGDLECEGNCSTLTSWPLTSQRWSDLIGWQTYASPQAGWNDLGPLEVGNTGNDGLNAVEQQSAITLWAMANAPLYLGGDLTKLDATGIDLLSNDEVIAVDQSGRPANQVAGGMTPVWVSDLPDGSFYVALFNLNAFPSPVTVKWSNLGFTDAPNVRDVWNRRDLGRYDESFTALILGQHGVRLLRVFSHGVADPEIAQGYEAELGLTRGQTAFTICKPCSAGHEIVKLGLDKDNTVTLDNIYAEHAGTFRMEIPTSATSGPRDLFYQVNDDVPTAVKVGGGSFNLPSKHAVVPGQAGCWIQLKASSSAIPRESLPISIVLPSSARETRLRRPLRSTTRRSAKSSPGTALNNPCEYCSGNTKIVGIGEGSDNVVTFPDITVTVGGMYQMEIDYLTKVPRFLDITINGANPIQLDLTGDSEGSPSSVVIPVSLKGGKNTIQFGNPDGEAPDLDKIAIALPSEPPNLTLSIRKQSGPPNHRTWTLDLANLGPIPTEGAQLNLLSLVQVGGQGCDANPNCSRIYR